MFYEADVVAGYIGSALYNIMFARRPIDVIGFINQSYLATNEYLICSALGHRLHLFYGDEVINGRKKDCEGRELGVTNRDYVFDFERDGLTTLPISRPGSRAAHRAGRHRARS